MKGSRVFSRVRAVVSMGVLIVSLALLFFSVLARIGGRIPRVFGYSFHVVITDSMTPKVSPGDLVVVKYKDVKDVEIGEDVVFVSSDPSLGGKIILHRVYAKTESGSLLTTGIKMGASPDPYPVNEIIGSYRCKSSLLGSVFLFVYRPENLIFSVITLALLISTYRLSIKIIALVKNNNN